MPQKFAIRKRNFSAIGAFDSGMQSNGRNLIPYPEVWAINYWLLYRFSQALFNKLSLFCAHNILEQIKQLNGRKLDKKFYQKRPKNNQLISPSKIKFIPSISKYTGCNLQHKPGWRLNATIWAGTYLIPCLKVCAQI